MLMCSEWAVSASEAKEAPIERAKCLRSKWAYYRRVFDAYILGGNSHLTFWHGTPEMNPEALVDRLGQYYMSFAGKAAYPGPFDAQGIPLLDYRGSIGRQYNPIAIAQYVLGNHNPYCQNGFIWALWGVYDYMLATKDRQAYTLFHRGVDTLVRRLHRYEWGRWSLYDLPGTRTKNVASRFYHRLHIVQLRATERLVANPVLGSYAERWNGYLQNPWYCRRAPIHKGMFELLRY